MSVQATSSTKKVRLYVRLLHEGTDVFRPVWAEPISEGIYELIAPSDYDPDDEEWEFAPGSHVTSMRQQAEPEAFWVAAPLGAAHAVHETEPLASRT